MKHPLDITLPNNPSFSWPSRVHVAVQGHHQQVEATPAEACRYYWLNGLTVRRMSVGGRTVYRLPWRYWRHRKLYASGEWRQRHPDGPHELVGILLCRGLSFPRP